MPFELLCAVADFVPGGFFGDKLMKPVFQRELTVEGICRNRKTVRVGQDLAQRRTANFAEASAVLVRGTGLEQRNVILPLNPLQVVFFDKHKAARTDLAAP